MKETYIKRQKKESQSWVLPGISLNQDEFTDGIKEAEKGPFHNVHESMENFELWMKSREKK